MSKTLFEQAIAEAKDVRKTALENAKLALEESMTSKLQNMFSSKLSEELNEDEDLEEVNESEDIDEKLDESDDDASVEDESDDDASVESDDDASAESDDDASAESEEESIDDQNVSDLSVEDLKTLIADTVRAELASEATPVDGDATMDDMSDVSDDVTNTDLGGDEMGGPALDGAVEDDSVEDDDDVNLEEVFAELEAINTGGSNIKEAAKAKKSVIKKSTNNKTGAPGFKKVGTLNEAYKTINILRNELKDVNLLNAKLIYVNSIFKGKNLNEAQKLKVIEKFDKAETIKEAKLLFETLMDTPKSKKDVKRPLRESMSFASKPAGIAPKKPIIVVDESVKRFQELAGIIKK